MSNYIDVCAVEARKLSHPNSDSIAGLNKLSLLVKCAEMPSDIPFGFNPREANERSLNKKIYKQVKESLLGDNYSEPGFFDLMNRGIVIIVKKAEYIKKSDDNKTTFRLHMPDDYGLVDGGHTYKIISKLNEDTETKNIVLANNQHVEVRIIEIPNIEEADTLIPAIARGLNSSVQVDDMSIANLEDKFQKLKPILSKRFSNAIAKWPTKDYESLIGYKQTDISYMDIKEIITLLSVLDVEKYPIGGNSQPVSAYSSPATVFSKILTADSVDKFLQISADALELYNMIQADFKTKYNAYKGNGRGGGLSIVEDKKRGEFIFPFSGHEDSKYRLMKGASVPILSAFRVFVTFNETTQSLEWIVPFTEVKIAWEEYSDKLIHRTVDAASRHRRNVANAIGKDSTHWQGLVEGLQLARLMSNATKQ